MPIVGDPIYVSAFGEQLSRRIYIERYKLDPEIAYQYMRRKRNVQIGSKTTNKASQSIGTYPLVNLTNIKDIEILCENCGNICILHV